ncbi:MAG: serine/threonine protein kinase [Myxococcales bacterium]|nr:serine/threonine protein kinase [Myxococcales bacterium]
MALVAGQILENKYRIERPLAQGAMGAVYVAENTLIQRRVAIKVLHGEVASNETWVKRFINEAQAAGQIGSEHIVEILDVGMLADGSRFMVMEYLEGETLREHLKARGRMRPEDVVVVLLELLDGLGEAHSKGIVHRDLKPANVFLQRRRGKPPRVKILDFGISKFSQMTGDEAQMTRTGTMMGTPYYMSPEQVRASASVDGRADVYAVGVILFEALLGTVPISAPTLPELMFKICFDAQPHPRALLPELDPALADVIVKAMARDPAARFQTAGEMHQALSGWLASRSQPAWGAMSLAHARPSAPQGFGASPGPGTGGWHASSPSLAGSHPGGPQLGASPGAISYGAPPFPSPSSQGADVTHGSLGAFATGAFGDAPNARPKSRMPIVLAAFVALGMGGVIAAVVVVGKSSDAATGPAATAAAASPGDSSTAVPTTPRTARADTASTAVAAGTSEPTGSGTAEASAAPTGKAAVPPTTVAAKPTAVAATPPAAPTPPTPTAAATPKTTAGKALSDFGY